MDPDWRFVVSYWTWGFSSQCYFTRGSFVSLFTGFYTSQVILWLQIRITLDQQQKRPGIWWNHYWGWRTCHKTPVNMAQSNGFLKMFKGDILPWRVEKKIWWRFQMGCHFGFQGGFSAVVAKDNLTLIDSKVKFANTEIWNIPDISWYQDIFPPDIFVFLVFVSNQKTGQKIPPKVSKLNQPLWKCLIWCLEPMPAHFPKQK